MKKNKQYYQLTNRQKILGSQHCYQNAQELYEEGELLYNHSKWARSTALFILGIEEISKIELLGKTFFYKKAQDWEKFDDKFRNHTNKLRVADVILLQIAYGSGDTEKLKAELRDIMQGRNFNLSKQKCFYVGYSPETYWQVPSKLAEKEDAQYCKKCLEFMIDSYNDIFSKPYNEIVDIVKEMKKVIPSPDIEKMSKKMKNEIEKVADSIQTKT